MPALWSGNNGRDSMGLGDVAARRTAEYEDVTLPYVDSPSLRLLARDRQRIVPFPSISRLSVSTGRSARRFQAFCLGEYRYASVKCSKFARSTVTVLLPTRIRAAEQKQRFLLLRQRSERRLPTCVSAHQARALAAASCACLLGALAIAQ